MPQFWAGMSDGKIAREIVADGFGSPSHERRIPALFTTKAQALEQYQDVRKVEVRIISKPKRK